MGVNTARCQRTLRINLDILQWEAAEAYEIVKEWGMQRMKAPKIIKAILLYADLERGNTDRLMEHFAWVPKALNCGEGQGERIEVRKPETPRLVAKVSTIEIAAGGKASGEEVAKNFLNSMKGMASGFFD